MRLPRRTYGLLLSAATLAASALSTPAQLLWTAGLDDNAQPTTGVAGGAEANFVQENGVINPLPGSQFSTSVPQGADNDYYFAGEYTTIIAGNGDYEPVGVVDVDEEAAERAFAAADNDLRYHFNLPATLKPTDLLSVTFDIFSLHDGQPDTRYGIEVYFNGVKVQPEILIRAAQRDFDYTTPQFTLESVNAGVGPGFDNIVSLRGINYNNDGGGNWMGIDYVQLNQVTEAIPAPTYPWMVGKDDNEWPLGDGGGQNASFMQENGVVNPLPGVANSPEVDGQADNDYYFGGSYTTVIAANGDYTPVGTVSANEEAAERAFAAADNELRYHFNLPNSLKPADLMAVTFEPMNLDTSGADARYGVEVLVNGVRVMPEVIVRAAQLNQAITTPQFSLATVNAQVGSGPDNIVTLRGINYNADGGGNWMGIDYVRLDPVAAPVPQPVLPWVVGQNDNAWPTIGNGGGPAASFVQENGTVSPLPGSPTSPEVDQQADNDYYLAGVYASVIAGNGNYTPVGPVSVNEEAAERAFAGGDTELRYHFNLPASLQPTDRLSISFDALNVDDSAPDPRWGVEVYVNNVKVMPETIIGTAQLGVTYSTPAFTVASVNAGVGHGFDNIVTLKGISYNNDGGGNWLGIDYIQMNPVLPPPFPWSVGKDDDAWPAGNGGGPNASFVQEAGTNPLPGNPASPEADAQADDDYYFAGTYTTAIPNVVEALGPYDPIGTVLVNEEAAERAFAGSDNEKRYHFNLPANLLPTDQLLVTFDLNNLDTSGADPHYGVEVYFNSVLIQPEIVIYPADLGRDITTAPFTLASVNAQVGAGPDNIVTLRGINYSADGGGQWMGIDYVNLDPMPAPVFPLAIGRDDNDWPLGDGGGANASFVQEAGVNELPGNPRNNEVAQQSDDDYYFAGVYSSVIPSVTALYGPYDPAGIVTRNEESAERAFAGTDNDLRYHFNLPATMRPTDQVVVRFDAFNLDVDNQADPRYGIEIYFNGVQVQQEILIRPADLDRDYTTAPFTLASVNAELGVGKDNVLALKGINYSADGGGNWMGIDYVQVDVPVSAEEIKLNPATVAGGKITLTWTGTGNLEWAPAVLGPWTPFTPAPASGYTEDLAPNAIRFYRLRK